MAWQIEGAKSQPQVQEPQGESFLQQAKRVGTSAGISALRGVEALPVGIADLLGYITGMPRPKGFMTPSETVQEVAGLTPEYLEPRNLPEQFIQRFSQFAPLAATGGLGGLGRTAVGSGVASLLGAAGLPEPLQDIAQLGTEIGLGVHAGKIPTIRGVQKVEDALARAAIKPSTLKSIVAPQIQNALLGVESKLGTEVSEKYATKIKHALETIENNISSKSINPSNVMDLRKKLYKLGRELPADISAQYLEPLTKGINDFFAVYAAENPSFYKHLKARDQLTALRNMNTITEKFAHKLKLEKIPGIGLISDVITKILNQGEKFARGLIGNQSARKYYFDAVAAAAEQNPTLFINNIKNLAQSVPEFKEMEIKPTSKWVLEK